MLIGVDINQPDGAGYEIELVVARPRNKNLNWNLHLSAKHHKKCLIRISNVKAGRNA